MQIAVTGGGGFIGSHVVDHLLRAGHRVRVVDAFPRWRNPAADYHEADLFDEAALARAVSGCAAVYHLAGASDVNDVAADPVGAVRLNVEGTARVLEAARRQGCPRLLLASTVWVYGATVREDGPAERWPVDLRQARHVYVATKLAAELLVHSYREMYGQRFTIMRYGIPYGPRMREALVIAQFVRAAREGRPITIAGTGHQQRHYVYVEDIADAHVRALSPAAEDKVLSLEGGTPVSVREIADTVREMIRPVPVEHIAARPADYAGQSTVTSLAKDVLGWSPITTFTVGLRRYLAWLALSGEGRAGAAAHGGDGGGT